MFLIKKYIYHIVSYHVVSYLNLMNPSYQEEDWYGEVLSSERERQGVTSLPWYGVVRRDPWDMPWWLRLASLQQGNLQIRGRLLLRPWRLLQQYIYKKSTKHITGQWLAIVIVSKMAYWHVCVRRSCLDLLDAWDVPVHVEVNMVFVKPVWNDGFLVHL